SKRPRVDARRASNSATAPGGKTFSMENIQSVSAAYATSGTMYPSDHDPSGGFPKGTMTLGRNTGRASYSGRSTATGSSPNITFSGIPPPSDPYGNQNHHPHPGRPSSLRGPPSRHQPAQDCLGDGEGSTLDLQSQLRELQKENEQLRREMDVGRDGRRKSGTVNSVNFWGPEMKRDRGVRREEGVRNLMPKDQYRDNQEDWQVSTMAHLPLTVQELQEELRAHREMNSRLPLPPRSPCVVPGCDGFGSPPPLDPATAAAEEGFQRLQTEHERKAKELSLLRRTMEEMEVRIEVQKNTLGARDESIQRLLEMLQGQGGQGGQGGRAPQPGIITMATQEAQSHIENLHVRELTASGCCTPRCSPYRPAQGTKISSLERNIRDLEDEGADAEDGRHDQVEVYKSHSKFMKSKIDQLKQELNKKESEMQAVQTKLETLTNQNSDSKQHIDVLKESLNAKEQRSNTLQTEVDALRVRLEEKEQVLTKKSKQHQDLSDEKSTLAGEIRDMKDMLEVKERKVSVLQKKIENLLEQLKDKDKQLAGLRERVKGLQTDSSNTDTALATLEEALSEKERVIQALREQRDREERARLEDVELLRRENRELKERVFAMQPQNLTQGPAAAPSQTPVQRPEAEVSMAGWLGRLQGELANLPNSFPSPFPQQIADDPNRTCPDIGDRLRLLEQEVARYREASGQSKAEVERLMGALQDAEGDRSNRDRKISELERQTLGHRSPEGQGVNTRGPGVLSDMRSDGALEKTRRDLDATKVRLSSTQQTLHERDDHLHVMRQERRKQLEEILEMKSQALVAAISEKDANIALLELSSNKRKKAQEEVMALKREKDRLMHQLKQQVALPRLIVSSNKEYRLPPPPPPSPPRAPNRGCNIQSS
uniref:ELKS/RAB6-interacting/CAST family member 2 n=1 Tax=Gadus morhua TaxID=8049 RepID=A0A8C4ZDX8_GADMO